jgi:flagellar biosynthesis chaperone FliJ
MSFRLDRLLQIRRRAEEDAEQRVARTTRQRALAEQEDERLAATFQLALKRVEAARRTPSGELITVAQAHGAERFFRRLADEAARAERSLTTHRSGPLFVAKAAEHEARAAHLEARREREALEKVAERQRARQRRVADRRSEDAASDLALAYRQAQRDGQER